MENPNEAPTDEDRGQMPAFFEAHERTTPFESMANGLDAGHRGDREGRLLDQGLEAVDPEAEALGAYLALDLIGLFDLGHRKYIYAAIVTHQFSPLPRLDCSPGHCDSTALPVGRQGFSDNCLKSSEGRQSRSAFSGSAGAVASKSGSASG
jgi:hypothetical protein